MIKHPLLIAATASLIASVDAFAIATLPVSAQTAVPILLSQAVQSPLPPDSTGTVKTPTPVLKFGLADGTPIKLKFKQTVSSRDAKTNDIVEFEVVEPVRVGNKVVIAQGAAAKGIVVEAQRSGMLGRRGKLDIAVQEVTLVSGERITLRASEKSGGGTSGGVIAAAVLLSPVALLFKGKNVTYDAGTEITAFVNGNFELNPAKF
ncbi:hypothetical protein OsccyDRAFT_1319 [Leptolyngbyaceae cyanobacterium JSC-12]|nr:hypothetical protein OsccyDRAFT_1319 [Leptolyngbyaceae cyanobacterium JSC-12]